MKVCPSVKRRGSRPFTGKLHPSATDCIVRTMMLQRERVGWGNTQGEKLDSGVIEEEEKVRYIKLLHITHSSRARTGQFDVLKAFLSLIPRDIGIGFFFFFFRCLSLFAYMAASEREREREREEEGTL